MKKKIFRERRNDVTIEKVEDTKPKKKKSDK